MSKLLRFKDPASWVPVVFFTLLLTLGFTMYRDYGLSWDDPVQRQLGLSTWDYIEGKNTDLLQLINRYHNPFVEVFEILPEKIFHLQNEKDIYLSRHLFNFLFCWVGLIFFYLLAMKIFRSYPYALIACLLFVLTPRPLAHCFYNSKDLPFLFLFVVAVYYFVLWLEKPVWKNVWWMILASGMLTGARVLGVIMPFIVLLIFTLQIIRHEAGWRKFKMIFTYFLLYPFAVYIFFPTIWSDPVNRFMEALELMSHYPFDVTTFFMGYTAHSLQTSWDYMLVWMGITIPLGWWFFFLVGFPFTIIKVIRHKIHSDEVQWLIVLLWLLVPLVLVIVLHSNLYEDGRHLFFIYPPFLLIATAGFRALLQPGFTSGKISSFIRTSAVLLVFTTTFIYTSIFMVIAHPYQYAFFNAIGRKYATDYFDKDYWGLSFRSALEFLVKYDKSDTLNVRWKVDPGEWNLAWLSDEDRRRIHAVHYENCEYYLTNYRSHKPQDASDKKIYEVKVQGITIMAVYKMHPPNATVNPTP